MTRIGFKSVSAASGGLGGFPVLFSGSVNACFARFEPSISPLFMRKDGGSSPVWSNSYSLLAHLSRV